MWSYSHIFARFAKKGFPLFPTNTQQQHSILNLSHLIFNFLLCLIQKWVFTSYCTKNDLIKMRKRGKWNVKVISSVDDAIFRIVMCISVKGVVKCSSPIRKRIFWTKSKFSKILANLFRWYKFQPNSDEKPKEPKDKVSSKKPNFCHYLVFSC